MDYESNIALVVSNSKVGTRIRYVGNIRVSKIKDDLRRMKIEKDVGSDGIVIEL